MKAKIYSTLAGLALTLGTYNSQALTEIAAVEYDWGIGVAQVYINSDTPFTLYKSIDGVNWEAITRTIRPTADGVVVINDTLQADVNGYMGWLQAEYKAVEKVKGPRK